MFSKMSRRNLAMISTLMIVVALVIHFYFDDFFTKPDIEIIHFIAGVLFAIGFAGLFALLRNKNREA